MKKKALTLMMFLMLVLASCSQTTQNSEGNTGNESTGNEGNEKTEETQEIAFPEKAIEMIIPYGAGGSTDIVARILGTAAQKYLPNNQTIVPVNMPGGGGAIGMTDIFNAEPDGYKIALANSDSLSVAPLTSNAAWSHDSFQPIVKLANAPFLLAVKADAPWDTFEDWLDYVKANPGKFTYGTSLVGGPGNVILEKMGKEAGFTTTHVPYDASGDVVSAVLGGNLDGAAVNPSAVISHVEAGTIKVLTTLGKSKVEELPDVPTLEENGFDLSMELFFAAVAPKGMDPKVQQIIHDAFKQAIDDPEVSKQLEELSINVSYAGADDLQKEFSDTYVMFEEVLKDIGIIK
ncbi:tripartite tricarboxylate transporter substrate binding protein [Robertmurraya massiliosenegalensis]|uniref:Bug family tripartite tricarboxylate transporter substrate binding protein n=1 Tax=Robertmurraya TaxID=2837507 RepID=UPI0039A63A4E